MNFFNTTATINENSVVVAVHIEPTYEPISVLNSLVIGDQVKTLPIENLWKYEGCGRCEQLAQHYHDLKMAEMCHYGNRKHMLQNPAVMDRIHCLAQAWKIKDWAILDDEIRDDVWNVVMSRTPCYADFPVGISWKAFLLRVQFPEMHLRHIKRLEKHWTSAWLWQQVHIDDRFASESFYSTLRYRIMQVRNNNTNSVNPLLWKVQAGFVPKHYVLRRMNPSVYPLVKTHWNQVHKLVQKYKPGEPHSFFSIFNGVAAFRQFAWDVVQTLDAAGFTIHDMFVNLNFKQVPYRWALWARKRAKGATVESWARVIKVLNNWQRVEAAGGNPSMSLSDLHALTNFRLTSWRNWDFAREAAKYGYGQEAYNEMEVQWLGAQTRSIIPVSYSTPDGKYTLKTLPVDDPRGLFLGEYTNCCQHPNGVGDEAAWFGVEDPNSCFIVLEKGGEIVAQSLVWRMGNVLCLDNIEALGHIGSDMLQDIYIPWSKRACETWGCKAVHVGGGYSDAHLGTFGFLVNCPTPSNLGYSDANWQHVIYTHFSEDELSELAKQHEVEIPYTCKMYRDSSWRYICKVILERTFKPSPYEAVLAGLDGDVDGDPFGENERVPWMDRRGDMSLALLGAY